MVGSRGDEEQNDIVGEIHLRSRFWHLLSFSYDETSEVKCGWDSLGRDGLFG